MIYTILSLPLKHFLPFEGVRMVVVDVPIWWY